MRKENSYNEKTTSTPAFIRDYFIYLETILGKSKNTVLVYFYDIRIFLRFLKVHKRLTSPEFEFNNIEINDIDLQFIKNVSLSDLYAFISFASNKRDNSAYARARKVASIKSLFKYLTDKAKLLTYNPASELESPKIVKRLPKYLNIEESKQLLNAIKGEHHVRDYAIITLFLNCGLRLSELVGINVNQVKNDTLTVIGKGDKERTIYLNKACNKAVEAYIKARPKDALKDRNALFLSERKQRISKRTVQVIVEKYIKAAGLDSTRYSTHKLRHTAATLMYKHGKVDIRALQEILGHESISTTEIYTHVDSQQLRNAVESNPLADFAADKPDDKV